MRILIVKHGALGDVVRTSYFAKALKRKFGENLDLFWVTATDAYPLVADNPYIDRLTTTFSDLENIEFDIVYSLDDEESVIAAVSNLKAKKFVGAVMLNGNLSYTSDASEWFDMGLLSNFGKVRADELKILNKYGHAEIFQKIFQVNNVYPVFYLNQDGKLAAEKFFNGNCNLVGINPYAGGRWPAKEIRDEELYSLINSIVEGQVFHYPVTVVLFGAGDDRVRNLKLANSMAKNSVKHVIVVADTDASVMILAGYISRLKLMITSDSLAMHLAIAQRIPTLAFFAPTSASEIDSFGYCEKLLSTATDYCSYAKKCDNTSITAERIINKISAMNL